MKKKKALKKIPFSERKIMLGKIVSYGTPQHDSVLLWENVSIKILKQTRKMFNIGFYCLRLWVSQNESAS